MTLTPAVSHSSQEWVTESQQSHSQVEGKWSVVVKPRLSSKRRPHFKTCKSLERTKICLWVPTGPETKNDYAGEDQRQFTGLLELVSIKHRLDQQWLILAPPGNLRPTPTSWNCSSCKTRFSAPSEIFQGAHRSAICTRLSTFRMYTII
jgi:hypothetical protein